MEYQWASKMEYKENENGSSLSQGSTTNFLPTSTLSHSCKYDSLPKSHKILLSLEFLLPT